MSKNKAAEAVEEVDASDIAPGVECVDLSKIKSASGLREIGEVLQDEVHDLIDEVEDLADECEDLRDGIDSRDATFVVYRGLLGELQTTARNAKVVADQAIELAKKALAERDDAQRRLNGARTMFVSTIAAMQTTINRLMAEVRIEAANASASLTYAKQAEQCNHGLAAKVTALSQQVAEQQDTIARQQNELAASAYVDRTPTRPRLFGTFRRN